MIQNKERLVARLSSKGTLKGNLNNVTVKEYPELENIEIIPTLEEQNFKSEKYGFENVKVHPIEAETLDIIPTEKEQIYDGIYTKVTVEGDNDLIPENIKEGTNIFGVEGSYKGGTSETAKITDTSYLFYSGARLDYLDELLKLCENPTNMAYMFYLCKTITKLDLSSFNTSNVTSMTYMLYGCEALEELDISNFDTSNVTNMQDMFYRCRVLKKLDCSSFNTSKLTSMSEMFRECNALEELDVSNFDTSNVTQINHMFNNCKSLVNLDLSSFDFSKVTSTSSFINNCFKLTNLKSFKNLGKGYTSKTNNYSSYSVVLAQTSNLTHESLVDIITNGLYDLNLTYKVAEGGTLYRQILNLGATNKAKLTEDEIAIATNKGWDVI